jgi:hypothetical protein
VAVHDAALALHHAQDYIVHVNKLQFQSRPVQEPKLWPHDAKRFPSVTAKNAYGHHWSGTIVGIMHGCGADAMHLPPLHTGLSSTSD